MRKLKDLRLAPEAREAAACELMKLADKMFRGAMSMMKKAQDLRVGAPPAKVISALRFYHTNGMPAAEEALRVEAILRGVPPDQCLSEADKRRQKKEVERQRNHEAFERYHDEEWQEFQAWKRAQRPGSAWAETRKPKRPDVVITDGVIRGPWGEAS